MIKSWGGGVQGLVTYDSMTVIMTALSYSNHGCMHGIKNRLYHTVIGQLATTMLGQELVDFHP